MDKINNKVNIITHTYYNVYSITYNVFSLLQVKYYAFIFFLFFVRNRHLDIVQFFVNGNHCQANAVNSYGRTALHYASL